MISRYKNKRDRDQGTRRGALMRISSNLCWDAQL